MWLASTFGILWVHQEVQRPLPHALKPLGRCFCDIRQGSVWWLLSGIEERAILDSREAVLFDTRALFATRCWHNRLDQRFFGLGIHGWADALLCYVCFQLFALT